MNGTLNYIVWKVYPGSNDNSHLSRASHSLYLLNYSMVQKSLIGIRKLFSLLLVNLQLAKTFYRSKSLQITISPVTCLLATNKNPPMLLILFSSFGFWCHTKISTNLTVVIFVCVACENANEIFLAS